MVKSTGGPHSMFGEHPRLAIVGTSGAGKTTLARAIARELGIPHIELDRLHHGPGWMTRSDFVKDVTAAMDAPTWVADGNYAEVRAIVWQRATAIIWLNYTFRVTFSRALARTLRRTATNEEVFPGCRETFASAFLSAEGIPWWVVRTFWKRRRSYPELLARASAAGAQVLVMRTPEESAYLLRTIHHAHPERALDVPRDGRCPTSQ